MEGSDCNIYIESAKHNDSVNKCVKTLPCSSPGLLAPNRLATLIVDDHLVRRIGLQFVGKLHLIRLHIRIIDVPPRTLRSRRKDVTLVETFKLLAADLGWSVLLAGVELCYVDVAAGDVGVGEGLGGGCWVDHIVDCSRMEEGSFV